MKTWECGVCGKTFKQGQSHTCQETMPRTHEEEICPYLAEGRCVAGQELEKARQVIRELREVQKNERAAWGEETNALEKCEKDAVKADEEIARLDTELEAMKKRVPDEDACRAAREEAEKLRADVGGLQLELEAKRVVHEKDNEFLLGERNEAQERLQGDWDVWKMFIDDCAHLLGLPEMDGCSEYGGGAIRKAIEELTDKVDSAELTADGVVEGSAEWEDDCKTAQKEVQELRKILEVSQLCRTGLSETISCYAAALEKINELRNDIIARQSMGWPRHIYPLVAALDAAGFEGMEYDKAVEKFKATVKATREMAAGAWGQEATKDSVMDVHVAEEFAEILFTFLETLEFYALLGNWQGSKADAHESVCDRDLGSRARATLGRPDRDVPEIIETGPHMSETELALVENHIKEAETGCDTVMDGDCPLPADGRCLLDEVVERRAADDGSISGTGGGSSGDGS